MTIEHLNNLSLKQLRLELSKCCGSLKWITLMTQFLPFENLEQIKQLSAENWARCTEIDWLEAFSYHPQIGEKGFEKKFKVTAKIASNEQSGVEKASKEIISDLAKLNEKYFNKFGFIFIIFASGKGAGEMLNELETRLKNNRDTEMKLAAAEQLKITQLRLEKMFIQ